MSPGKPRIFSACSGTLAADESQPAKFGVGASGTQQVVAWRLAPLQEMAACRHRHSEQVYVVVSGDGVLFSGSDTSYPSSEYMPSAIFLVEPPEKDLNAIRALAQEEHVGIGDAIVIPADVYHYFRSGEKGMLLVAVTTPPSFNSSFLPR